MVEEETEAQAIAATLGVVANVVLFCSQIPLMRRLIKEVG
jgi:hypothetical protein